MDRDPPPAPPAPPEPTLELEGLRAFVTVVRHGDALADDGRLLRAYLAHFAADDDATLLVYDARGDEALSGEEISAFVLGIDVPARDLADVVVVAAAPEPGNIYPLGRAAQAVLGPDGSWLTIDRPVYDVAAVADLRAHADAYWGRRGEPAIYSYEASVAHLVDRGWCSEAHVREGSIPEPSLHLVYEAFKAQLPADAQLLHVGNFLGVSLAYLLAWSRNEDRGPVVSIDPDVPHRGVASPQDAVVELLAHFGLDDRHLLVCGYSLEQSLSNDGVVFGGYDPASRFAEEAAPQDALGLLLRLGLRFHGVLIDGNHDARYLRRELAVITQLLQPGGLLVLDDVNEWWAGVLEVFEEAGAGAAPYEHVAFDRRIGILRRLP